MARPWALARAAHAAGGICSTVRDQLRYARFHMGDGTAADGTRLLTPESIAQMQTPRVPAADGQFFGVTWFINQVEGARIVRHGGATNGQLSAFVMVPARRFAITVLTNADRGGELNQIIVKLALREFLGIEQPNPAPLEATEQQLAAYAGRYSCCLYKLRSGAARWRACAPDHAQGRLSNQGFAGFAHATANAAGAVRRRSRDRAG